MSPQRADITLRRFVDEIPVEASHEEASGFLSQKVREHGLKVFVRKPAGASVFENGFPRHGPQFMHFLSAMPFPVGRIKEEIAKAKLQGHVIDYGMEEPEIRFLELDEEHVLEIASKKVTKVHWFVGDALRAVKRDAPATATSGLIKVPPCLRCLRPSNDFGEMLERRDFGGALKYEAKFRYEFRIHDIFVHASDLGLLRFVTHKPSTHGDPFGLHDKSFAVRLAYRAAKKFHVSLLNRTKKKVDVIQWLNEQSSKSPYTTKYVADQIFKYLNPYHHRGIGSKVLPWDREALRTFRDQHPKERYISDGLALIISASIWWSKEHDRYVRGERPNAPPTKEVSDKLRHYGFSGNDEIRAILEVIRGTRSNAMGKPKAKTESEKRPPMQVKSRVRKAPSR